MKNNLPVIILKGLVLLPYQEVRLELNNTISRRAINIASNKYDDHLLFICPLDQIEESPEVTDLPKVGVVGKIKNRIELPNGNLRIVICGIERVMIDSYYNKADDLEVLFANISVIELPKINETEECARVKKIIELIKKYIKKNPNISNSILPVVEETTKLDKLTDLIASFIPFSINKKLYYTEELNALKRAENLIKDLNIELEIIALDRKIDIEVKSHLEETQKEFILREKIKEIKKILGEEDYHEKEIEEYKILLGNLKLSEKTFLKLDNEINKYAYINAQSPEASIIKNYLDTVLSLPWNNATIDEISLKKIQDHLNKTHYGLDKVKTRIVEYIAIKKRNPEAISPILCLVGPSGVGKTTLAMSIASSLKKEFYKISVGGLNDSNELIGHRRTYIGANPGKIITGIKKCNSNNPLILIDEIDKMVKDFKGDPASTLLDILDVNQNKMFVDNYIEEPFDLSNVLFVTTANNKENIPLELLDRLEIIEISSYTNYEKLDIAKKYLIPQIYNEHKISSKDLLLKDQVINTVINYYTRESGVRELSRKLATIVRKLVTTADMDKIKIKKNLSLNDLEKLLGKYEYDIDIPNLSSSGVVNGLAWTMFGGVVMPIEVASYSGKGKVTYTGNISDIMNESAEVALNYIKSNYKLFKISLKDLESKNIHIHFLEAAIKKDGPSGGVAITTAIISLLLNKIVPKDIAMTGEISLKGNILKVGGVKEKVLGAYNYGIKTIYLPKTNERDLDEIPLLIKNEIKLVFVEKYTEIFESIFN